MFAGISTRLALWGILALAVATIIGLSYRHYSNLVEANARLRENQVQVEGALDRANQSTRRAVEAAEKWERYEAERKALEERTDELDRAAGEHGRRLREKFDDHDLEGLAKASPGLVERRVNDGTADVLRLLESATRDDRGGAGPGPTPAQ